MPKDAGIGDDQKVSRAEEHLLAFLYFLKGKKGRFNNGCLPMLLNSPNKKALPKSSDRAFIIPVTKL